jgi:hypothetical protein
MKNAGLHVTRMGSDPYDSVSANGWYIMAGDEALAGPYCDRRVAHRHLEEREWGPVEQTMREELLPEPTLELNVVLKAEQLPPIADDPTPGQGRFGNLERLAYHGLVWQLQTPTPDVWPQLHNALPRADDGTLPEAVLLRLLKEMLRRHNGH